MSSASPATAQPLTLGNTVNDSIAAGQAGYYAVNLMAGGCYTFSLFGQLSSGGTLQNPELSILASTGQLFELGVNTGIFSNGQYVTTGPQIGFIAPYSGTYYIEASSTNGSGGTYTLGATQYSLSSLNADVTWALGTINPNLHWTPPASGPLMLTYCFLTAAPVNDAQPGVTQFSANEQAAVIQVLDAISAVSNIQFVQSTDQANADIRYGNTATPSTNISFITAYNTPEAFTHYVQNSSTGALVNSDVWFNSNLLSTANFSAGGPELTALIQETCHALGLKYPGNYGGALDALAGGVITGDALPYAPAAFDNQQFSDMSYNTQALGFYPTTPMSLDIAALQNLYGLPSNPSVVDFVVPTQIYGAAPVGTIGSTIDFSSLTGLGSIISLTPGTYCSTDVIGGRDNVLIPWGSQYTVAIGSSGNDLIIGNSLNDTMIGGGGANTFIGGAGIDTVVYSKPRADYSITQTSTGYSVFSLASGTDSLDTLTGIDRIKFSDGGLAFDLNGHAGTVAKILGAVFGASSVNNAAYVGIGLQLLDGGMSEPSLSMLALNAKLGSGFSNSQEISLLYQNLLGVVPNASDILYWSNTLASGQFTTASLSVMAEETGLNVNNINLTGLSHTGIAFS